MDPLNREFLALLDASGWSKAEAARQLDVTPSLISQYAGGGTRPSPQMVRLFKLVLATERPEALEAGAKSPELRSVQTQVREIHERDAGAFRSVRAMVDGIHRSLPAPAKPALGKPKAKLDPVKEAELSGAALLGAKAGLAALGLKQKAASTSGSSGAQDTRARRAKGAQRPPAKPAPTELVS